MKTGHWVRGPLNFSCYLLAFTFASIRLSSISTALTFLLHKLIPFTWVFESHPFLPAPESLRSPPPVSCVVRWACARSLPYSTCLNFSFKTKTAGTKPFHSLAPSSLVATTLFSPLETGFWRNHLPILPLSYPLFTFSPILNHAIARTC